MSPSVDTTFPAPYSITINVWKHKISENVYSSKFKVRTTL